MTLDFWQFVHERQSVWRRRADGLPRPWTKDSVLHEYRFTNVFRELDRGTQIAFDIQNANKPRWARAWNCMLYRRFNNRRTWETCAPDGWVEPDTESLREFSQSVRELRGPWKKDRYTVAVFSDAHMITNMVGVPGEDLVARAARWAWDLIPQMPELDERLHGLSMRDAYGVIAGLPHSGPFLGYQMVQDLTYGPDPSVTASVDEWAPASKGALSGLRIIAGEEPTVGKHDRSTVSDDGGRPEDEETLLSLRDFQDEEFAARDLDFAAVAAPGYERLTASAVEHTLCEYSKYRRFLVGGKPGKSRHYREEI